MIPNTTALNPYGGGLLGETYPPDPDQAPTAGLLPAPPKLVGVLGIPADPNSGFASPTSLQGPTGLAALNIVSPLAAQTQTLQSIRDSLAGLSPTAPISGDPAGYTAPSRNNGLGAGTTPIAGVFGPGGSTPAGAAQDPHPPGTGSASASDANAAYVPNAAGASTVATLPQADATHGKPSSAPSPVTLIDGSGQPVSTIDGAPAQKPGNVNLADIAALGTWARTQPIDVQLYMLSRFKQGGPMDFQRQNGVVDKRYVDFATIALGVFAAAMGWKSNDLLWSENFYANRMSHFGKVPMSPTWLSLPERNVYNTYIGYKLYNNGSAAKQ